MFKELICAVAISGTIGMTAPQNSNDETYYQDVTITETYEYETNEVTSVDDLVIGNIYHLNYDDTNYGRLYTNYLYNVKVTTTDEKWYSLSNFSTIGYDNTYYIIGFNSEAIFIDQKINNSIDSYIFYGFRNQGYTALECDFVYNEGLNVSNIINSISASDYLGAKTITITPKEFNGLFSIFDNFLHERLFSGGILDTTNVTVFNATMSLGQWLSTTASIVLLCLIVLLLILLIKFIFKYVGGMMIWRS